MALKQKNSENDLILSNVFMHLKILLSLVLVIKYLKDFKGPAAL